MKPKMKSFLLIATVVVAAGACRFPPQLWCSSPEIAKQCKVYSQCKETAWKVNPQAPLVEFELYYESLCPDCRQFITEQLISTYRKVADIMNITLVPYGNAREVHAGGKWRFICQHGRQECIGNLLETCAIHVLMHMEKIMPFINCMEMSDSPMHSVQECTEQQSIPLDPIMSCFNSSLGNQLEHQMALKTEALKPPHKYVPWIVLNGVHTEKINNEATRDLLQLICDTYTGPQPSACTKMESSMCARSDLS